MKIFVIRRLFLLPIILIGVTMLIFGMMSFLSPYQLLSTYIESPAQLKNIDPDVMIANLGLDDPAPVRYFRWLKKVLSGNLGFSESAGAPVLEAMLNRFPATLELALFAILPVVMGGIWLGTIAAVKHNTLVDHVTRIFAIIGWSLPTFVFGLFILMLFYQWFPAGRLSNWAANEIVFTDFVRHTGMNTVDSILNGRWDILLDTIRHLVGPIITLSYIWWAFILKITRSSMLETLRKDYITTARAKGLKESVVIKKHARRNAMIPVVTVAARMVMGLLAGVMITETVFNYKGMGLFMVTAAQQLDYPAILGGALFFGSLLVLTYLVVDVLYAVIDPRINLE